MSSRKRVTIIGGGFGGLAAASAIGDRHLVTLVDPKPAFEFKPNIHEVVSGRKKAASLRIDLARVAERLRQVYLQDRAEAIDLNERAVHLAGGGRLEYDALVVAPGSTDSLAEGADRHAFKFWSVDDATALSERLDAFAAEERNATVTIVGGSFTGMELLGELLRKKRYRRNLRFRVVESRPRILAGQKKKLTKTVEGLLDRADVDVLTGVRVRSVSAEGLHLDSGAFVPSDLVVWTAGRRAPSWLAHSGLMDPEARFAPTTRALESTKAKGVFIAGDAADCPQDPTRLAWTAIAQGTTAGKNVLRFLDGKSPRKFKDQELPLVLSFGDESAFLFDDDFVLESAHLGLLREVFFQGTMVQLEQATKKKSLSNAAKRYRRAIDARL